MAFARRVLLKVPTFAPELGPGAIRFGDDTLFSLQLHQAGYRITAALNAEVEHHLNEARLINSQWLDSARKMDQADADLVYHRENSVRGTPRRHFFKAAIRRLTAISAWFQTGPALENLLKNTRHFRPCLQYVRERRHSRNYSTHGLVKQFPAPMLS